MPSCFFSNQPMLSALASHEKTAANDGKETAA